MKPCVHTGCWMKDLGTVSYDSIRFIYDIDTVESTRGVDFMYGCTPFQLFRKRNFPLTGSASNDVGY